MLVKLVTLCGCARYTDDIQGAEFLREIRIPIILQDSVFERIFDEADDIGRDPLRPLIRVFKERKPEEAV